MAGIRNRALFVAILASLTTPQVSEERSPTSCPFCGHEGKCDTGECAHCGTYRCKTCDKYHLGNPNQLCNGQGVDIPGPTGRDMSQPELQRTPPRTEFGRELRGIMAPSMGESMLGIDYNQLELRVHAAVGKK